MIRCPLKLILFGEHSILRGGSCLAVAVKIYSEIVELKKSNSVKIIDNRNNEFYISFETGELKVLTLIPKEYSTIRVNSYFGCGLGTSASISLLLSYVKFINYTNDNLIIPSDERKFVLESALVHEDFFHHKSSGVDVNSCFFGGLISFKNKITEKLNLTTIKKYKILLYDSKISKNTCEIIKLKMEEHNINKLALLSKQAYDLLQSDFNIYKLYRLIREAQDILEDMGLVPEVMKNEVRRLRKLGIESKVTGAGCGGHLFTFVPKDKIIEGWFEVEIEETGFNCYFS